MSDRSKEISKFITANMQDANVIDSAIAKFDMDDKEIEATKIIQTTLAPINAMMNIFNIYGELAKEGLQMIEEVKLKHGIND